MLPSEYFRRQGMVMFMDDPPGLQMAHYIGIDNICWGDDYPHQEGTWPYSGKVFDRSLGSFTDEEKRKLLGGNIARLLGIELPRPAVAA